MATSKIGAFGDLDLTAQKVALIDPVSIENFY